MQKLRGQTYNGASNMSGAYNGCQAIIARDQPFASFVHCSAHCTNLVANAVCSSSSVARDAIQLINDFGVLCNQSGKVKSLFAKIASSESDLDNDESSARPIKNIKPLCPTRWFVRMLAINNALKQYLLIMKTLEEAPNENSTEISARDAEIHRRFENPTTLMRLTIAQYIIEPLESLNKLLQSV